jgi:deoxyribodipyrimidine photolyase
VISVLVFTRDLRVADNPALSAAVVRSSAIVPLFVLDDDLLAGRFGGHVRRLGFLLESLADLDASLRALGGALVVRRGPWVQTVLQVALLARAGAIHLASDVSGFANARLTRLRQAAASAGITVLDHPGVTVVPPSSLCPPGRVAYQVFTPYYRRWLAAPRRTILSAARCVTLPSGIAAGRIPELRELTGATRALSGPRGGEHAGLRRLRQWAGGDVARYQAARDDLGADETSRLSAYLHLGCLDWRLGAAHFPRHLVDGDLACDQLNWQWVAGTGTDTRPSRTLSPVRQSRRHDPGGDYIRRWGPELAHLPAGEIHEPGRGNRRSAGYPEPVIDHLEAAASFRARQRHVVEAVS